MAHLCNYKNPQYTFHHPKYPQKNKKSEIEAGFTCWGPQGWNALISLYALELFLGCMQGLQCMDTQLICKGFRAYGSSFRAPSVSSAFRAVGFRNASLNGQKVPKYFLRKGLDDKDDKV